MNTQILYALCLGSVVSGLSCIGHAQNYPNKSIRVIVPFAAASATDLVARSFTAKMSETLGQNFIVENKPGANGLIGADSVAKAIPDGYTIMVGTNSTNAALKSLMKKLPYDQDTAFAPVAYLGQVPLIVAINNEVAAKSLRELVVLAKSKPGLMAYASASTSQRVSTEMLLSMTGVQMIYVPYKSGPAAMTDLISGQVHLFTADFAVMLPQVNAGKVRGLAVTSTGRSKTIPELPSVNEALGLKDYELIAYFAIFAPTGTPSVAIQALNRAANQAANDKELLQRFSALGFETSPGTPEALSERTKLETVKWAKAIRDAKIEPE